VPTHFFELKYKALLDRDVEESYFYFFITTSSGNFSSILRPFSNAVKAAWGAGSQRSRSYNIYKMDSRYLAPDNWVFFGARFAPPINGTS